MRRVRSALVALACVLAVVATPVVAHATQGEEPTVPVPTTDAVVAEDVLPEEEVAATPEVEEVEAEPKVEAPAQLTSFEIANGDIALDGINAYQVAVHGRSINFRVNAGAEYEVTDVTISDERVAEVDSYESPDGTISWSISPKYVGGTATLTATAVDANDPTNVLTDSVTVTCTPGKDWTPVSDFTIGAGGVVTISMDTANNTPFPGVFAQAIVSYNPTWLFDVDVTIADTSVARFEELEEGGKTIIPLKPGETAITVTLTDEFYGGTKIATGKLVVTDGPATSTSTNEQGASFTYLDENGAYYSQLELVTEWLDGDAAQKPYNTVIASVDGVTDAYVYDIHLAQYYTGEEAPVLEGDSVTVTLPIPEGLSADGLHVFHVADDGTVTDMGAVVDAEGKYVSFTTSHFSTFVLANVAVEEEPGASQTTTEDDETTDDSSTEGASESDDKGTNTAADSAKDASKKNIPATGDAGSVAALLSAGAGTVALLAGSVARKRR